MITNQTLYPLPTMLWLKLVLPEGLCKREVERIAKRVEELLDQGVIPAGYPHA